MTGILTSDNIKSGVGYVLWRHSIASSPLLAVIAWKPLSTKTSANVFATSGSSSTTRMVRADTCYSCRLLLLLIDLCPCSNFNCNNHAQTLDYLVDWEIGISVNAISLHLV